MNTRARRSGSAIAVVVAVAALAAILLARGNDHDATPRATPATGTVRAATPTRPTTRTPARAALTGQLALHVTRRAYVRTAPGGAVRGRMLTKTTFGSPVYLAVVERRPGWVRVRTSIERAPTGWVPADAGRLLREPRSIVIDLSKRQLLLKHGRVVTATYPIAVGADATPTPRGTYAVTDMLRTASAGADYGCCILALTAHQQRIAQGWGGGDRIAIHGTPHTWTIGDPITHGCLRASNAAMHSLMARVRLGTHVTIRA